MSAPTARRGFLRGLVSLPLIGGGVTLIGSPSAVAAPPTAPLLRAYETWLGIEHFRIAAEMRGAGAYPGYQVYGPAYEWHGGRGFSEPGIHPASTRAALVLAAVDCDWREGGR